MIRQLEIINVDSGELFAKVAITQDGRITADGISAKGSEWSSWINAAQIDDFESTLPPYACIKSASSTTNTQPDIGKQQLRLLQTRVLSTKSILPALRSIQLISLPLELRPLAIDYKTRAFASDSSSAQASAIMRTRGIIFNPLNGSLTDMPSLGMNDHSDALYKSFSGGLVRDTGISIINSKIQTYSGFRYYDARDTSSKSAFRKMRRIIPSRFDPNAIDADGDMIVQEGTPFQRPASPKPQGMVGGARDMLMRRRGAQGVSKPREVGKTTSRSSSSVSYGPTPSRARQARVDVSSSQQMAPRKISGSRAITPKQFQGNPGAERVSQDDGAIWASLTPEERLTVARRARALEDQRFYQLTGITPGGRPYPFHKKYVARQKNDADEGRVLDGPTRNLLEQMQTWVDEYANSNLPEKARLEIQRFYDDLLALYNMRTLKPGDSYEFLEHLHPSARAFLFDDAKRADGETTSISPKQKIITAPSNAFGRAGGYESGSPFSDNVRTGQRTKPEPSVDETVSRVVDVAARKLINRLLNPKSKKKKN